MAKQKTANLPDLSGLLEPIDGFGRDVQRVLLRHNGAGSPSLSIGEQVAAKLARLIALDRLRPDQRVLEQEICAVLAVSRAPVREALQILQRDRLVVVVPRRGARVSGYNAQELHDIFEVRASLLSTLLEGLVKSRPFACEQAIADALAEMEEAAAAASRDAYAQASFRLIVQLCELCENHLLSDFVQSLALQTLRYARLGFSAPGGIDRSLRDWRAMLRALRCGEPERVPALAGKRIAGSRDAALEALRLEDPFIEREGEPNGAGSNRPVRGTGIAPGARLETRRRGGAAGAS